MSNLSLGGEMVDDDDDDIETFSGMSGSETPAAGGTAVPASAPSGRFVDTHAQRG